MVSRWKNHFYPSYHRVDITFTTLAYWPSKPAAKLQLSKLKLKKKKHFLSFNDARQEFGLEK